jgi:hypothetical protein
VWWQALKADYENTFGPHLVMIIKKFFGLHRIDGISMDAHLIKVKNVHIIEEVKLVFPKDIIVYYMIQALP